jgi:2-oxoglutarate ferredoxin oxidoreductase subunit alpha
MSFTIKIGGPAGLGIMTTGSMIARMLTRAGFSVFDYTEYPSLIRGGHNVMEVRFSESPVYAQEQSVDLLIALNKETVELHKGELKNESGVLFDPKTITIDSPLGNSDTSYLFPVPFSEFITKLGIPKVMENNIALGAVSGILNLNLEFLFSIIEDTFMSKGEKVINDNKKAAQEGWNYVTEKQYMLDSIRKIVEVKQEIKKDKVILTGNEAVGMGAISAGCKFYSAYPMTPSSSLLHFMADYGPAFGIVVRHAEDEIGVINEVIGASFAGVRAMLGTSGGGFALMNESVALGGITETPLVLFISQRPGPATGLPTWTEQGDLQYIIRSGHGEFPKIVLTPGDIEESFFLTKEAFNLADIYQTPVIILLDKYVSESHMDIEITKLRNSEIEIQRGKIETVTNDGEIKPYLRYKVEEDGISPRALPGTKGFYYQANSYEHIEDGHTTESSEERKKQVEKRNRKAQTYLVTHFVSPTIYGAEEADITIVGWGSTKLVARQLLQETGGTINGKKVNYMHFTHVWPMDGDKITEILKSQKRLVLVENNSTAQFGQLLRQETGIKIDDKYLKYDGRPVFVSELVDFIKTL